MGARTKLNVASVNGAILVAVAIGVIFGSPLAFFVAVSVLVVGALVAGDIRLRGRQ